MEDGVTAGFGLGSALKRKRPGPEIQVREVEVVAQRSAGLAINWSDELSGVLWATQLGLRGALLLGADFFTRLLKHGGS